jgi:hypothetical protein
MGVKDFTQLLETLSLKKISSKTEPTRCQWGLADFSSLVFFFAGWAKQKAEWSSFTEASDFAAALSIFVRHCVRADHILVCMDSAKPELFKLKDDTHVKREKSKKALADKVGVVTSAQADLYVQSTDWRNCPLSSDSLTASPWVLKKLIPSLMESLIQMDENMSWLLEGKYYGKNETLEAAASVVSREPEADRMLAVMPFLLPEGESVVMVVNDSDVPVIAHTIGAMQDPNRLDRIFWYNGRATEKYRRFLCMRALHDSVVRVSEAETPTDAAASLLLACMLLGTDFTPASVLPRTPGLKNAKALRIASNPGIRSLFRGLISNPLPEADEKKHMDSLILELSANKVGYANGSVRSLMEAKICPAVAYWVYGYWDGCTKDKAWKRSEGDVTHESAV